MTLPSQSLTILRRHPIILVRGVAQDVPLPLRDSGAGVTPTSGTTTWYRDTGETDLYAGPTALVPGDPSSLPVATIASTEALSNSWIARHSIVVGGVTYPRRERVFLVGTAPALCVDQEDLFRLEPGLQHPSRLPMEQDTWTPQALEAHYKVLRWLTQAGKQPWLSVDQTDFYQWELMEFAALSCGCVPGELGTHYKERASYYRAEAAKAANACSIEYETDPGIRRAVGPCIIPAAPNDRPRW